MASFNALTIQSGVTRQIHTGSTLVVGDGIDSDASGPLTVGATASSLTLTPNATASGTLTSTGLLTASNALTVTTGTTTLGAALTQSGGAVSLTATGASSFTSTAALTLTAGAASTWSTSSGALTVDSAAALDLGTSTATSVSISKSGVTTTVNGNLTVASGQTTTLAGYSTGVIHSTSGVLSSSLIVDADVSASAALSVAKLSNGTAGQFLIENAGATAPTWTSISADVTASAGTPGALTVVALQGNPVDSTHLTSTQDGYVATWNNTTGHITFESAASSLTVTLNGDVTGLSSSNTVVKINGTSVPATPSAAQVLIAQSGTAALWETVSLDATLAASGALTVVSSQGNFTVGAAGSGNLTIDGSGTFTTGTGTNTINGATVFAGVGVTASGAGNFDFSGSTGTFLTSTGANTLSGSTTLAAGKSLTAAAGAGAFDFSAATGTFKTSTGANTLEGDTTVAGAHTLTVGTGLTSLGGGLTVSAGTVTVSPFTTGVVTANGSGVLSSTQGTAGQLLMENGTPIPTWTTMSGDATISATGVVTVTSAAGNFEVHGNLTVDGAETIIGTSTFQSNAEFAGNVTIDDGYTLTVNTITSNSGHDLTIEGATGFIDVPDGMTLRATGTGQIIATSSSGTSDVVLPNSVVAQTQAAGTPVYLTSGGVTTPTDSSAIASSYFVGISAGVGLGTVVNGIVGVSGPTTVGMPVYLGTSGTLTSTAPTTAPGVVAQVGLLVASGQMLIQTTTPVVL